MRRAAPVALLGVLAACSSSSSGTSTTAASGAPAPAFTAGPASPGAGGFAVALGSGFRTGGAFDISMTCASSTDYSPPLTFSAVPAGTAELAVTLVDTSASSKVQWIQVHLPAASTSLMLHTLTPGATELPNDFGEATYDGPCPAKGSTDTYLFTVYALPTVFGGAAATPTATVAALAAAATSTATVQAVFAR